MWLLTALEAQLFCKKHYELCSWHSARQWCALSGPLRGISGLTSCLCCGDQRLSSIVGHWIAGMGQADIFTPLGETVWQTACRPSGNCGGHDRFHSSRTGQCRAVGSISAALWTGDESRAQLSRYSAEIERCPDAVTVHDSARRDDGQAAALSQQPGQCQRSKGSVGCFRTPKTPCASPQAGLA